MKKRILYTMSQMALWMAAISLSLCSTFSHHQPRLEESLKDQIRQEKE